MLFGVAQEREMPSFVTLTDRVGVAGTSEVVAEDSLDALPVPIAFMAETR